MNSIFVELSSFILWKIELKLHEWDICIASTFET